MKSFTRKKIPYCIGRIFSFTHKMQSEDFVVPSIMKKIDKEIIHLKTLIIIETLLAPKIFVQL